MPFLRSSSRRAALRCRVAVCGDVVDFLLPFFHAGNVVFQRHGLRRRVGMGRSKTQRSLAIASWLAKSSAGPSFSTRPNCCQKVWYFSASSFASFSSICSTRLVSALRRLRPCCPGGFHGNVQRQIAGVNQATHEAQIVRHKLFSVVHDKHALNDSFRPCL